MKKAFWVTLMVVATLFACICLPFTYMKMHKKMYYVFEETLYFTDKNNLKTKN